MSMSCEIQTDGPRVGAVIVAAGESRRMDGIDKILYPLSELPLIWHSISALSAHPQICEIVLVTSRGRILEMNTLLSDNGFTNSVIVCEGGERRQDSVRQGLERLDDCDLVVVHDGARPFITSELLDRGISMASLTGAATAAVPVKDTIKESDEEGVVVRTIPRDRLWSVQTPQIFRTSLLRKAHSLVQDIVTDDASMVEAIGHPVKLFFGSYSNIKITTPEDLAIAEAIFNRAAGNRAAETSREHRE